MTFLSHDKQKHLLSPVVDDNHTANTPQTNTNFDSIRSKTIASSQSVQIRKIWTKQDIQKVYEARTMGLSLKKIGKQFNVTANAIRKALLRHSNLYNKNKITSYKEFKESRLYYKIWHNPRLTNISYKQLNKIYTFDHPVNDVVSLMIKINNYRHSHQMPTILLTDFL